MISPTEIRQRRMAAGISVDLVSVRSGIDRCTVSLAERGLLAVPQEKIDRIADVIDQLIATKALVREYAITVGWPASARL